MFYELKSQFPTTFDLENSIFSFSNSETNQSQFENGLCNLLNFSIDPKQSNSISLKYMNQKPENQEDNCLTNFSIDKNIINSFFPKIGSNIFCKKRAGSS
jgi:hypothetical protein